MASTDKLIRIILKLDDQMTSGLNNATSKLDKLSSKLTSVGQGLTAGVTLPVVAFGTQMFKTFADFESVMTEVQVRTGATAEGLERLTDTAKEMGRTTMFSATEAADALLELTSSGSSATEAIEQLKPVLDLAAAGSLELKTAADGVTDILAQFGLEAEHATAVVNNLAMASGSSSATVSDLIEAFKNAGPVAKAFGLSVQETSAALAVLAENGIKGAEAGTQLKSMLLNMSRKTDKTSDAWRELGISMFDSAGNMRDIDDVFKDINKAMEDMSMEDQIRLSQDLAGSYGIVGFNALRASNGISDMQSSMLGAATASEMADAQMNTMNGAFAKLRASFEGLMLVLGELGSGPLVSFVNWLSDTINMISAWAEKNPKLAQTIMMVVAALATLGPVLIIIGSVVSAVSTLSAVFAGLSLAALGPIGLIILGLGALYLAFQTNLFGIKSLVTGLIGTAKQLMSILLFRDFVGGGSLSEDNPIVTYLINLRDFFMETNIFIKGIMIAIGVSLLMILGPVGTLILAIGALQAALGFWKKSGTGEVWKANFAMLGQIIELGTQKMIDSSKKFGQDFPSHINNAFESIKEANNNIGDYLLASARGWGQAFQTIGPIFQKIGLAIMQGLIDGVKSKIASFLNMVKGLAQSVITAIKDILQIKSPSRVMAKLGEQTTQGFQEGLGAMGGFNVGVPTVPQLGNALAPSLGTAGAGGTTNQTFNIQAAPGTSDEQVNEIARRLGKLVQKRI